MSSRSAALQKPRHIAPSIHVLAMRLAQNTADRITIGNTPLHILHMCDAQYLAPLFPCCTTLRAITVHLRYVASATALELFLKGAATCPSLRDVFLIGGATPMEAAAISVGLAAFTFAKGDTALAHFDAEPLSRAPPRTRCGGRGGLAHHRYPSPFSSPYSSAVQRPPPPCFTARERRPWLGKLLHSPSATDSCPASPASNRGRGRGLLAFPSTRGPEGPLRRDRVQPVHRTGLHRRPSSTKSSSAAASVASSTALRTVSEGVHLTLELHRVTEETSAVLLDGLRCGTRILASTIHLRVATADARLAGLQLAQRARQVTQQHREQQPRRALNLQHWPHPPLSSAADTGGKQTHSTTGGRQRVACVPPSPATSEPPPCPPSYRKPTSAQAVGIRAPYTPPSPYSTPYHRGFPARYAFWVPAADSAQPPSRTPVGVAVAPHTPPAAHVLDGVMRPSCGATGPAGVEADADVYRRRGRHFFSSERVSRPAEAAALQQAWASSQPLRLRAGQQSTAERVSHHAERLLAPVLQSSAAAGEKLRAARQRTPQPSAAAQGSACLCPTATTPSPTASSSFSPIVLDSLVGFRRGRSSSFSSWSSRSTSPQPRPPPRPPAQVPTSPAAHAFASLTHRELNHHRDRKRREGQQPPHQLLSPRVRRCETVHGQPWAVVSPRAPPSSSLCSPRYCLRRGRDDLRAVGPGKEAPYRNVSSPALLSAMPRQAAQQQGDHYSMCSCFVCAATPQQKESARSTHNAAALPVLPPSPRTPTLPRSRVREVIVRAAASAARSLPKPLPSLPSPFSSPSVPTSSPEASPSAVAALSARPATPQHRPFHRDCQIVVKDKMHLAAGVSCSTKARAESEVSDDAHSGNTSTPGITARTSGEVHRSARRVCSQRRRNFLVVHDVEALHSRQPSARSCQAVQSISDGFSGVCGRGVSDHASEQQRSRRCVSRTQLPSSPDSTPSSLRRIADTTSTSSSEDAPFAKVEGDSTDSGDGYIVYPNSLKFLRERVAEINRHVVWHQVKAAKEAEAHAKHLANLEVAFAGRVTEQLSDILMVLTDMEHGSRSGR